MDYTKALEYSYSDKEWLVGDTYESLVWLDMTNKPTDIELLAAYDLFVTSEYANAERAWRDAELAATDFVLLSDAPFTIQQVTDMSTYRIALRDMPALIGFPLTHTRPTKPI